MTTSNVIAIFTGTIPFDVNVAACDLLTDLSVKDFSIINVTDDIQESSNFWTKVTPTTLRYVGGSPSLTLGDSVEIRRKTPNVVVQPVTYASRFSSDLWNKELDRITRWREEADLNGVGAVAAGTSTLPDNSVYSLLWANDTTAPPTRQTLFNYFNSSLNTAFKNKLMNGRFNITQRGVIGSLTSTTLGSPQDKRLYLADKWTFIENTASGTSRAMTVSREIHTPGQTQVPDNPKFFLRVNTTALGAPATSWSTRLVQSVENVVDLAGKTVTLSLYARSSIAGKGLGYRIIRNLGTGGSGTFDTGVSGIWSLSSDFTRYSVTFTMPTLSGLTVGTFGTDVYYIMLYIHSSPSETPANVNAGVGTVDISDVQLELGSAPTAIEPVPFTLDLVNCMRYYQQGSPYGNAPNTTTFGGKNFQFLSSGSGQWADTINLVVPMATTPSVTVYASDGTPASITRAGTVAPATVTNINTNSFLVSNNSGTSAATIFFNWEARVDYV